MIATAFSIVPESSRQAVIAIVTFFASGVPQSQLVLVCSGREKALKGTFMQNLAILDILEVGVASGLSIDRINMSRIKKCIKLDYGKTKPNLNASQ